MIRQDIEQSLDAILAIALAAGKGIMEVYDLYDTLTVVHKSDNSPLTQGDSRSHEIIVAGLRGLFPEIPILSEEGRDIPYEERKGWQTYWCVDPLDGTKEFIAKNGQFTVNIALIVNNEPWFGVIYVPAQDILYYGFQDKGSFKVTKGLKERIFVRDDHVARIAVGSRLHQSAEEERFLKDERVVDTIHVGSSLKFCMVAEGAAHIYYRHGPTMEWDTAAGHAIVLGSGGQVSMLDGQPLAYNKESLLNPSFICRSLS